jgi:hypothetical protein
MCVMELPIPACDPENRPNSIRQTARTRSKSRSRTFGFNDNDFAFEPMRPDHRNARLFLHRVYDFRNHGRAEAERRRRLGAELQESAAFDSVGFEDVVIR